ncbi:unnamed protein product, partial [marine sediment metagenome]
MSIPVTACLQAWHPRRRLLGGEGVIRMTHSSSFTLSTWGEGCKEEECWTGPNRVSRPLMGGYAYR